MCVCVNVAVITTAAPKTSATPLSRTSEKVMETSDAVGGKAERGIPEGDRTSFHLPVIKCWYVLCAVRVSEPGLMSPPPPVPMP